MAAEEGHGDKELDLTYANRSVWLVKVPKYISNLWDKSPGNIEVGKLKLVRAPGQKAEVSLTLPEAVLALKEPDEEVVPKNHMLDVSKITSQSLGVFAHKLPTSKSEAVVPETEKLSMEGRIVQKLECLPCDNDTYMKLKVERIKRASIPTRKVVQLDNIVNKFKPVSNHKYNIEYLEKKKAEGKKMRGDKDAVLEMLFAAFEKHQYYNIKDLVKVTNQPIVYLKEILNEVCIYNSKHPHKNMWELKPEYRCYKKDEEAMEEK